MSSTILYKFRSGATFEALPLPGSAARLFDVKKAIVQAKKLDQGSIEFDLKVIDATTNEEYSDESMLLPRGTRVVVQRLPAAKGHGFLARLARSQYGMAPMQNAAPTSAPSNFYTIDSREHEEDEEFVSSAEDKELAALRAATDTASSNIARSTGARATFRPQVAGSGGPPPNQQRPGQAGFQQRHRPNADPELRDQEKQLLPKKRATGIPRTFLNLSAPPATDAKDGEGGGSVPLLQPNAIGFEELVNRGGGQSENASGTKRDLDYALKLTASTIPEYLQCAICHSVVRDAMILPWDPEGRTTCDSCIRDALTQNAFRCPLTNQEGVSPDDLLPNHALRKAAEQFVKGVMEKMEEVEKQQEDDDVVDAEDDTDKASGTFDADAGESGVLVSRRTSTLDRKKHDDDPFGGADDDFGGDVFAVETKKKAEPPAEKDDVVPDSKPDKAEESVSPKAPEPSAKSAEKASEQKEPDAKSVEATRDETRPGRSRSRSPYRDDSSEQQGRRDRNRRGPPMGYAMGPAGGAVSTPIDNASPRDSDYSPRDGPGRGRFDDRPYRGGGGGGRYNDRGRGRYGGRGRFDDYREERHEDVSIPLNVCLCACKLLLLLLSSSATRGVSKNDHLGRMNHCFVRTIAEVNRSSTALGLRSTFSLSLSFSVRRRLSWCKAHTFRVGGRRSISRFLWRPRSVWRTWWKRRLSW